MTVPQLCRLLPLSMQVRVVRQAGEALLSQEQGVASVRAVGFWVAGYPPSEVSFDDDGFLHYTKWEKEISEGTFKPLFEPTIAEYEARFARFESLDPRRRALFLAMLDIAEQRGIRVHGFITPLHASVRERLARSRNFESLLAQLRAYLAEAVTSHAHFTWVDFTDPASFGGEPDAFYDGAHPRDQSMRLIAKSLFR